MGGGSGGQSSGSGGGSSLMTFEALSHMPQQQYQPQQFTGTTIPTAGQPYQQSEQDYFGLLMDDLYQRMKARSAQDTGEIGYADESQFSF